MNINYHYNSLIKSLKKKGKWQGHSVTQTLINEYERLDIEQAMKDYIADGDLKTYVTKINEYDRIIGEFKNTEQATNPVSWPRVWLPGREETGRNGSGEQA